VWHPNNQFSLWRGPACKCGERKGSNAKFDVLPGEKGLGGKLLRSTCDRHGGRRGGVVLCRFFKTWKKRLI